MPVDREAAPYDEPMEAEPVPVDSAEDEARPSEEDQLPVDREAAPHDEPVEAGPVPMDSSAEEETATFAPSEDEQLPAEPATHWEDAAEAEPAEPVSEPAAADVDEVEVGPEEPPPPEPASTSLKSKPTEEAAEEETYHSPVLLDVLSQSVGLAHFGGHYVPLIKRFAKLPARASQVFTTCKDNQERIRITVMQGDGKYVKENTPLGEFVLDGIEEARRGVPQIEVTFDIDQSGLFIISACDKTTGAEKEIRLESFGGASEGSEA